MLQVVVIGVITGTLFLKGRIPTNTIQVRLGSSSSSSTSPSKQ
jgi:hypothetical protein